MPRMGFGDRLAVVVIDLTVGNIDERLTPDPHARNMMEPIARLLEAARSRHLPVFFTTGGLFSQTARAAPLTDAERGAWPWKVPLNDRRGTTAETVAGTMLVPRSLGPRPGETVIRKIKPSGFFESPLHGLLAGERIDTLIVCGTATNSGVLHTVCEAFSYNFRAIVPRECCNTKDPEFHEIAFEMMDRVQADVMGLQAVVDEIRKRPVQPRADAITQKNPALVLINRAGVSSDATGRGVERLLAAARAAGAPVIHVDEPNNDWSIQCGPPRTGREPVIYRRKPSAFCETPLKSFLTYYRAETVVLCGAPNGLTLLHTANDAYSAGYTAIVAGDSVEAGGSPWHEASLKMIADYCGRVLGAEDIVNLFPPATAGAALRQSG